MTQQPELEFQVTDQINIPIDIIRGESNPRIKSIDIYNEFLDLIGIRGVK